MADSRLIAVTLGLAVLVGGGVAHAGLPGDLNEDQKTNVADAQCCILVVLHEAGGGSDAPPQCLSADPSLADLNCDGVRNVLDVQALIRLVLHLGFTPDSDFDQDQIHDACDPDDDGDGEPDVTDCAPKDASRGYGVVETCDGIDNDCDGSADVAPSGAPVLCQDGNPCTVDACLGVAGCIWAPGAGACDDGDACTVGDLCVQGLCVSGAVQSCDDGNPCTHESCSAASGCASEPAAGSCTDGDVCTAGDVCKSGVCASGPPLLCNDGNPCTTDSCSKVLGCVFAPSTGTGCNDGDACTLVDVCSGGQCVGQVAVTCDDGNPCTHEVCEPALGCVTTPLSDNPCSDGDACTGPDLCLDGVCAGGEPWCGGWGGAGCFADTDDQGCDGCGCEGCVCSVDPYCCDVSWDPTCVSRCKLECGATCALAGSCCNERPDPACSSATVSACVCNALPECCNDAWTAECVAQGIACGSGCPD